jgi:LemA protein
MEYEDNANDYEVVIHRHLSSRTKFGKVVYSKRFNHRMLVNMEIAIAILVPVLALLLYAVSIYNRLVKNKNMVQEGWSGIDVQLKRRANLIPNLIETVKGYMSHERDVLENVTALRTRSLAAGAPGEQGAAEGLLGAALGKLFAVAESYPELKANENFTELHASLDDAEEQIQLARRYYNGAVRNLNILIESFPSNLIANAFSFGLAEYFELDDETARVVPKVSFEKSGGA